MRGKTQCFARDFTKGDVSHLFGRSADIRDDYSDKSGNKNRALN